MRAFVPVLLTAAIGGSLVGCGASAVAPERTGGTSAVSTRPADPPRRPLARPRLVRITSTPYGRALSDRRGFALYRFTHDTTKSSTCYGACAVAWRPYLVSGEPARQSALRTGLVGTIRRTDGRLQVTYAGHPLYYYVGDRRPGEVLCQGVVQFGGGWYVVARSGHLIR